VSHIGGRGGDHGGSGASVAKPVTGRTCDACHVPASSGPPIRNGGSGGGNGGCGAPPPPQRANAVLCQGLQEHTVGAACVTSVMVAQGAVGPLTCSGGAPGGEG